MSSAVVIAAAMFGAARGANFVWDSDAIGGNNAASGAGLGGTGIWDTLLTTPNWWGGGATNSIWNSAYTAIFAGSAGTVTLGVPITTGNLVFNTSDYVLSGSPLTLGANAIVNLHDRDGAAVNTTISSQLAGSGMTLNGNGGTLTLDFVGTHAATGTLNIRSGTLQVIGATSVLDSGTGVTFTGSGAFVLNNVGAAAAISNYSLGALTNTGGDGVTRIERTESQNVQLTYSSRTRTVGATGLFQANGSFGVGNFATLGSNAKISVTGAPTGFMPGYFAKSENTLTGFAFYDAGGFVREMIYNAGDPLAFIVSGPTLNSLVAESHNQVNSTLGNQGATKVIQSLAINGAFTIPLTAALTVATNGSSAMASDIGSILKVGGGAGAISNPGGGSITAGASRELVIRADTAADTLTISAPIAATTGAVTKSGEGTLILSGANAFAGTTYVNGGTLTIRGSGAAGTGPEVVLAGGKYELLGYGANDNTVQTLATGKNVTVTGTGTLAAGRLSPLTDAATNKTLSFGTLTIGNQVLTADPAVYAAGANPPFAGVYSLSFTGATTFTDALPATFNVTGTQASTATPALALSGVVQNGPGVTVGFIKRGTGTLELGNAGNTFGGAGAVIELQQGVLKVASDGALGNAANSLLLNAGDATDALLVTTGFTTARNIALGQVSNTIEVAAGTLELGGLVTSNISADLIKRGAGTLRLTNTSNLFGGAGSVIDLQAGRLETSTSGALGSAANTVELSSGTFAATASLTAAQNFLLGQTSNTIDVVGVGNTLTIGGLVSSTGTNASLVKTGAGNLTLTNSGNSFGGPGSTLDIQGGGTLEVTSGGALGDPANAVKLGGGFVGNGTSTATQKFTLAHGAGATATFDVPGANIFTLAGVVENDGANTVHLSKTGTGTLELTNVNTFGGAGRVITVSAGTLAAQTNQSLGDTANSIVLNGGGFRAIGTFSTTRPFTLGSATNAIGVSQGNTLTFNNAFGLSAADNDLVKGDLGTLALTAAQAGWTGQITINAGAIRASGANANILGATAPALTANTVINSIGGLELTGSAIVAEPLTINTPGDNTTMVGSNFGGVLRTVLASVGTYTGAITVNGTVTDNTFRSIVIGADAGTTFTLSSASSINFANVAGTNRVANLILSGESINANTLASTVMRTAGTTLDLIKTGKGTWVLAPTTVPQIDGVVVRSGTLQANTKSNANDTLGVLPTTASLTFTGSSTFRHDNVGAFLSISRSMGALTFSDGDGIVRNERTASVNSFLTFASLQPRQTGATGLFWVNANTAAFATNAKISITAGATANTFLGPGYFAQANATATGFAWYDTGNFVRTISYTGTIDPNAVTIASGNLTAGKYMQTTGVGAVGLAASTSVLSLHMAGTNALTVDAGEVLTINSGGSAGGLLKTGGAGTIVGAGTLTAGGVGNELIIRTDLAVTDTLAISIPITDTGALTKSGLGDLTLSGTQSWSGGTFVNGGKLVIQGTGALGGSAVLGLSGGAFSFQADGDGSSSLETIGTSKNATVDGADAAITVGKLAAAQSLNKTVTFADLSVANQTLLVTGNNGYGLKFTGGTSFTEALPPTFNVAGTQASNVVAGLTLAGVVSSGGVGLIKSGTGTLVLENSGNTFGSVGGLIDIQGGVVAAGSDGALGHSGNNVALNVISSTQGFRAIGTFATDRVFSLNTASNQIEVTQGNVLTLNKGLNFGGAAATSNVLSKNNNGVLELGGNSPATWTGAVVINAGAIRLKTASGLGATTHVVGQPVVTITNPGIALQLSGNDTVYRAYPITISNTGIDSGGALENVSGDNLWTGPVTAGGVVATDPTVIGASGGTLTLTGGVTSTFNEIQTVTPPGTVTTFTLTFNGQTTAAITRSTADGTAVQNALQALSSIGAGNVLVTGAAGGPYTATFAGTLGNVDVAQMTSTLVSGTGTTTHATTLVGGPRPLTLAGAGNVTIGTTGLGTFSSLTKIGSGTATIGVASTAFVGNLAVNAGTFAIKGSGAKIGGTGTLAITPGATVTIDDTGTPVANRLSSRTTTFTGGTLNLIGSGNGNTLETLTSAAAVFSRGLSTITVTAAPGRQAVLNFNVGWNNVAPAQNTTAVPVPSGASVLFRATNLGQPLVGTSGSGGETTHPALPNVAGITISDGANSIVDFNGQTGARDTVTKGILPWALVDTDVVNGVGTAFATFDTSTNPLDGANNRVPGLNPIRALRPGEMSSILTANANLNLFSPLPLAATTNFNSVTLQSGGGLVSSALFQITLSSGGILAMPGNAGISGGILNAAAGSSPLNIWTPGAGTSLNISSTLTGGNGATTAGLIKAGAGLLILSAPQSPIIVGLSSNSLNAMTVINQGTLRLSSGKNTLFPNNFLEIGPGGTLDLAGNSQWTGGLFTDGAVAGAGGVVTSSTGTGTLVVNNSDTRNWAGSIQGSVAYSRNGAGALTIYSDQTYTGPTQFNGATTTLRDAAAISGTSSVDVNFATLLLESGSAGTLNSSNRVNDPAPVTLGGAALTLAGRPQTATTETMGDLTLAPGLSTITANASSGLAATGIFSADLTFGDGVGASLSRQAGAVVNFVGQTNGTAAGLGLIGNQSRILFANAPTLTSQIIGPWAIVTGATPEFASYVPTLGVGALGTSGFAAYDATTIPAIDQPTQNIRITGAPSVLATNRTLNTLNLAGGGTTINVTFSSDAATLTLASGGLIHSGNSSLIGAATATQRGQLSAGTTNAPAELLIFNGANTLTINSKIVNNAAGGPVSLVLSGTGTITLAAQTNNTYSGGTTINNGVTVNFTGAANGVTVFPNGGLTLNGVTVTTTLAGQVASGNVVTINGASNLTLVGNNTLGGLAFNNPGGTANPQINTGGLLTLGAGSSVSATSSNVATTSVVAGRLALPAGTTPFAVDSVMFNGVLAAPTLASLILQGVGVGVGTGGITKTGEGILQFNAQALFTGQVDVQDGGIQFATPSNGSVSGARFANLNLGAGTRVNLNTGSGIFGSLSGSGLVTDSTSTGQTLTVGFNDASTVFSGRFVRFGDGIPNTANITKIGSGTLNLTGADSDTTATFSIQGGTVRYSGAANSSFGANNVLSGATLTLDNGGVAANNKNNRLGGLGENAITLTVSGGTVKLIGNNGVNTTENINTITVSNGAGVLDLTQPGSKKLAINVVTALTGVTAGGTLWIKNLPTLPDAEYVPVDGEATILLPAIATSLNAPAGFGNDTAGPEMPIRPDIVATADGLGGPATAFVTKDAFNNLLRPLASIFATSPEVLDTLSSGAASPTNYHLMSVAVINENTSGYSLVLENAGIDGQAPAPLGQYGPNATLLTQTVVSGGILAIDGTTNSIEAGLLTTGTNVPLTFHAYGDLDVTANVGAGTGGITKSGTGTLTLAGRGFYTGVTTVNAGTLMLNGPQENSIAVVPAATTALTSALALNGGTIDLNGRSQAFGTLSSNNPNTGVGGTVTNTDAGTTATLTSSTGTSSTFSGQIAGNLNFVKTGNSTLTMTGPSTYTGTTTLRGGAISLRDLGSLLGTSAIDLHFGALTIDHSQLNPDRFNLSPTRIPDVPISMYGSTLTLAAGGAADYTATINETISLLGGASTINSQIPSGSGSSATLTLGSLDRVNSTATLNFNGTNGTLGSTGFNVRTIFNSPPPLANFLLGPWATVGGSDYAGYGGNGVVALSSVGGAYITALTSPGLDTNNVNLSATASLAADTAANVLRLSGTISVNPAAGITLTLGAAGESGGILNASTTTTATIGAAANVGSVQSNGSELFVIANSGSTTESTTVFNSKIIDNTSTGLPLALVKSGGGTVILTANNTHTGGTVVNQGTLLLNNVSGTGFSVPGDLLINNATTTFSVANQLQTNAHVTIDGSGILNMTGSNTISRVTFNNRGGNSAPSIRPAPVPTTPPTPLTSTNLTLNAGGATATITSTNDVMSTTPTISGTSLTLSHAQPQISTSGVSPTSLLITAPIHSAGGAISKTGAGSVVFNPNVGLTATTTGGNATLSGLTTTTGLAVGMSVSGTNIAAGSVIEQILPGGTSLLLSLAATGTVNATATNTITFAGSTFTNGFTVNSGTLILGSSSVLDAVPAIINGPVGKGTLTLANGASLMSDNTLRTLHNDVTVQGNFTFGPPTGSTATALAGGGVNLAGDVTLTAGAHSIAVNGPLNISTISGLITGGNNTLTKTGDGTLVLAKSGNNWGGALAVAGGVLRNGIAGAVPAGIDLSVSTGAIFDTPGVNQVVKTLTGGGAVTNSSTGATATLFVGGTSIADTTTVANSTFAGSIAGIVGDNNAAPPEALALTKVGAGTLTLTGANTYRGATNVNSGTLIVGSITGSLRIASTFSVNNGATAQIDGQLLADSGGSVQTTGVGSRLRGSGTIGANTNIGPGGILEPTVNGGNTMTFNNTFLDIFDGAKLLYTTSVANDNRVTIIPGAFGGMALPTGTGWTLTLQNTNIVAPHGMTFVLFDGDDLGFPLNNNNNPGNDFVGFVNNIVLPPGWSLDPTYVSPFPTPGAGVHFDSVTNDIVLVGVIPEPGSGTMLLGSLAVALGLQRFRRRRK